MARETSVEAYNKIKRGGLLSKSRWEVYDVLFNHGPLTAGEVCKEYFPQRQRDSLRPRFAELRDRGVVKELPARICRATGQTCVVWDVTANLPAEVPAQPTRRERWLIESASEDTIGYACKNLETAQQHLAKVKAKWPDAEIVHVKEVRKSGSYQCEEERSSED
jgi:hypothetical protein